MSTGLPFDGAGNAGGLEQFSHLPGLGDLSGVPSEELIAELANQFFQSPPVPTPTTASGGFAPSSGSGISPSAVNQGNSVDLNDPQTSLPDPHFAGAGVVPSSVAGVGASPSAASYKGPQRVSKHTTPVFSSEPLFYFIGENSLFQESRKAPQISGTALPAPPYDVNLIRRDFPILHQYVNGRPLVWLDNAATTQKPTAVIDRISDFYRNDNSNIHRAAHELAARSTDAYEGAREKVRRFLNAGSSNEIVFVRGATEGINLVAKSWGRQHLQPGDEVIVTHLEHHANIVPWQQLAAENGVKLKVVPVDEDGQILLGEYGKLLTSRTRLVSLTQVSNALGTVTPAQQMTQMAHSVGAKVLVDGAQAVSHMPVDVRALDADWYVFSGHKVFGPTGIGVLYGKEDLLNATEPWQGGGNMIKDVTFEHTEYQPAPARFEAGTGNIADAVGLGAALDYVMGIGMHLISQYEHYLLQYGTRLLKEVPGLRLIGTAPEKAGVWSFILDGFRTEQVGAALNAHGIAVRSGHHCAQPILRRFGQESTVRPSLALYNTCSDIDALVSVLHRLSAGR